MIFPFLVVAVKAIIAFVNISDIIIDIVANDTSDFMIESALNT
jgi:hypothetical protein